MTPPVEKGMVLVVDDVEFNRILAHDYLELLGWRVTECAGSFQALNYLCTKTPEYILLDIRMPDIDGVGFAKIVGEIYPANTVKIIAYTAHVLPDELTRIYESGFDDILIKPVSLADMKKIFKVI